MVFDLMPLDIMIFRQCFQLICLHLLVCTVSDCADIFSPFLFLSSSLIVNSGSL